MKKIQFLILGCVAISTSLLTVALTEEKSQAAMLITATEDMSGVTFSASGTLDVSGLGTSTTGTTSDGINPSFGVANFVAGSSSNDAYSSAIVSGPSVFGTGGGAFSPTTSSGSPFILQVSNNRIGVPTGFTSGSLSGELFYSGATFDSLGITAGTYVWNLANGDTVTLNAGDTEPVPEPSTILGLLGVGSLGLLTGKGKKAE